MICKCGDPVTVAITYQIGEAPNNPKLHGTQADTRRMSFVGFCDTCWKEIMTMREQK